jgi:hypothetical protein
MTRWRRLDCGYLGLRAQRQTDLVRLCWASPQTQGFEIRMGPFTGARNGCRQFFATWRGTPPRSLADRGVTVPPAPREEPAQHEEFLFGGKEDRVRGEQPRGVRLLGLLATRMALSVCGSLQRVEQDRFRGVRRKLRREGVVVGVLLLFRYVLLQA